MILHITVWIFSTFLGPKVPILNDDVPYTFTQSVCSAFVANDVRL